MADRAANQGARLNRLVSFRLAEADHSAYLAKVHASGLRPSEFFRDCVLRNRTQVIAKRKPSTDKERLIYLFNKASNNVNQLAHRANSAHLAGQVSEATYARLLGELHALTQFLKARLADAD